MSILDSSLIGKEKNYPGEVCLIRKIHRSEFIRSAIKYSYYSKCCAAFWIAFYSVLLIFANIPKDVIRQCIN